MRTSKWMFGLVAAGLLAAGLVALRTQAAENTARRAGGRGELLQKAREKLNLTDEQVAKIKTELAGEKDTIKGLITKLHEARVAVREAIQASDANESSVRAASAKLAAVEADMAVERLKLYGRISPILTGEQREQVKQFQSKIDDFVDSVINRFGDKLSAH